MKLILALPSLLLFMATAEAQIQSEISHDSSVSGWQAPFIQQEAGKGSDCRVCRWQPQPSKTEVSK